MALLGPIPSREEPSELQGPATRGLHASELRALGGEGPGVPPVLESGGVQCEACGDSTGGLELCGAFLWANGGDFQSEMELNPGATGSEQETAGAGARGEAADPGPGVAWPVSPGVRRETGVHSQEARGLHS